MYKSVDIYSCQTCGKSFKNSASLASHKYRYHPYSPKEKSSILRPIVKETIESDSMSSTSNISSSNGVNQDLRHLSMDNQMIELDVDNLQSEIRQLRSFVNKIDTKVLLQAIVLDGIERDVKRQRVYNDTTRISRPEEVSLIKDQARDNANKIRVIEDQMTKFENAMQQLEEVDTNDESEGLYEVEVENESEDNPSEDVIAPVQLRSDSEEEISLGNPRNEIYEGTETDDEVTSSGEENVDTAQSMQSDSQFEETDDQSDSEFDYKSVVTGPKTRNIGL